MTALIIVGALAIGRVQSGDAAAEARRSVMAHTDAALSVTAEDEPPPHTRQRSRTLDELAAARRIVEKMQPRKGEPANAFVCEWYAVATSALVAKGWLSDAGEYIEKGMAACPVHPHVLVWQGIVADLGGTILPVVGAVPAPPRRGPGPAIHQMEVRGLGVRGPEAAEAAYRRALQADPSFHDARLRLGELLGRLPRRDEALRELDSVITSGADRPFVYLAHLLSGRIKEQDHDLPGAAAEYELAMKTGPGCQSAYIALSFVQDQLGQPQEARATIERLARMPEAEKFVDPAWGFRRGGTLHAELLQTLRSMVRP